MNWLGYRADRDNFGKALLDAYVTLKTIKDWCLDPVVGSGPVGRPATQWTTPMDYDS